jgi:hypothetical protein
VLAWVARLVSFVVLAWPALAITITGKVADENGVPVERALITIVQANSTATSDATGAFRMEVPAAGDYSIRAEREGFFVFSQQSAMLDEGAPLEIRLNHLKELAESVDVRYSPPVIDPEQTSETKRLNSQEILNVPYPANQDYRNAFQLMPGALIDNAGQLHFNGGDTWETNYRLNGFDISDPATGGLNARLNVDAVQTLEWNASRYSPKEGRGSAGTVEVHSEMGDDRWRFGTANFIPGLGTQDGLHVDHWSPRVKFSGPVKRGRAWFSNALDAYYTVHFVSGLPNGQNQTRSLSGSDLLRLQWNITRAQILTVSFLANLSSDRRNGLSILSPAETTLNRKSSLFTGLVKDQWTIGGGLVEFGFATSAGYLRAAPQGSNAYVITPFGAAGNYFSDQTAWTQRQEWMTNGFIRPFRYFGTHQIETGFDLERSGLDQAVNRHEYTAIRLDNTVIRSVQFLGSPRQFRHDLGASAYLLDRWSPAETLTLEAGVRFQWDEFTGREHPAPRIAASWSPKWAGGARFSAGWGIFYDAITLNMLALSQEQTSVTTIYSASGVPGPPVVTQVILEPHDLRLPRFTIASLGVERNLPWKLYGKVNLVSREGSRGFTFEDVVSPPGMNLYVLDNIQRQHYRAAEFSVRRTFLAKYQWFASYTHSAAHANAVVAYNVDNPIFSPQAGGPLPWDAPNRFLTWGWAPIERTWFPQWFQPIVGDTDLQVLLDFRSGYPFSALTEVGTIAGAPNSYRLPYYGTVNLALERKFPFHGYLWAWRVGVVNALDRANPNAVNTDIDSPAFRTYARGQSRAVNVRLRFLGKR